MSLRINVARATAAAIVSTVAAGSNGSATPLGPQAFGHTVNFANIAAPGVVRRVAPEAQGDFTRDGNSHIISYNHGGLTFHNYNIYGNPADVNNDYGNFAVAGPNALTFGATPVLLDYEDNNVASDGLEFIIQFPEPITSFEITAAGFSGYPYNLQPMTTYDFSSATPFSYFDLHSDGSATGNYVFPEGVAGSSYAIASISYGAVSGAVPEPVGIALLGLGLLGVGSSRYRRTPR